MTRAQLLDFLAGSVTVTHLVAATFFLRFWRRTRDRLFAAFGVAFLLFAANQSVSTVVGPAQELSGLPYVLRVVGFLVILYAIVRANVGGSAPK